jgi:hypothetical protein
MFYWYCSSEIHYNVKGKAKVERILVNSIKTNSTAKIRRTEPKGKKKGKDKAFKYHKCGGPNHFTKKCQTPQHLVELY